MASNENFCLRLNSFDRNVKTAWQEMQMEEDFCDVTLACQDKQIKTHKLVVSSYSPVLRNILKSIQNPHPFIYLNRVKYKDLQNLLNFMYQGEVNVPEEDLFGFLKVAEDLNIRGLSEGNMEGCESNEEDPPQFNPSNLDPSPKRNRRTIENENPQNISDSESSHSIIEYEQADESFVTSDNISNTMFVATGKQRITKKNSNEGTKQNAVATLAEKKFNCGKCDKQYASYHGLYFHNKDVHEGVQYSCHKCEYKATRKSEVKRHVKSIHEGKRYPCDQCDYKATRTGNIRKHQLKHHHN